MIKLTPKISIEIHESNTCTYVTEETNLETLQNFWVVNIENPAFSLEIKFLNEAEAHTFCKNLICQGLQA